MMRINDCDNVLLIALATITLVLNGCGTTPPSRFYVLEAMPGIETVPTSATTQGDSHIGIGPVEFAEYLDRAQIVTRTGSAEVKLAETHRWAEPLHNNFARILAENLSILLDTDKISLQPSRNWSEIDYQVLVNVWQFDASKQGEVSLVANWSIRAKGGAELLTMKKSAYSVKVGDAASYTDIVRALSKTVELLSREIAKAIQSAHGQQAPAPIQFRTTIFF